MYLALYSMLMALDEVRTILLKVGTLYALVALKHIPQAGLHILLPLILPSRRLF